MSSAVAHAPWRDRRKIYCDKKDMSLCGRLRMIPTAAQVRYLTGFSLVAGLADGLAAFFARHIRDGGSSSWIWTRDLISNLVVGVIVTGIYALITALLITAIANAAGKGLARLRGRRTNSTKQPNGIFLVLAIVAPVSFVCFANILDTATILVIAGAGAFALVIAASFLPTTGAWEAVFRLSLLPVSVFVTWVFWYTVNDEVWRRFSLNEIYLTWARGAIPIVSIAIAFLFSRRQRRVSMLLASVVGAVWLAAFAPIRDTKANEDLPNIVMVVVDTLRTDRVWGEGTGMPSVKELARTGVYYENAYTALPKTQQSVSSFMTGLYPWNNGVRGFKEVLRPERQTLAELLANAGYRTAAFVHNPWIDYGMGHEQGFDEYQDYFSVESAFPRCCFVSTVRFVDRLAGVIADKRRNNLTIVGSRLTDATIDWINSAPEEPYFLWVHYFDPHWPYTPGTDDVGVRDGDRQLARRPNGKTDRKTLRIMRFEMEKTGITREEIDAAIRLYDNEVSYTDREVQRLLGGLDDNGNTMIVFLADHGESLGDHNYYFFHGNFTYEVCLKVPLVLSWPGHLPQGEVVTEPVRLVDLKPTVAALIGLDPGPTDGFSLPGLGLSGEPPEAMSVPFLGDARGRKSIKRIPIRGNKGRWRGVIADGYKLIAVPHRDGFHFQLYDLRNDPGETNDLSASDPQRVASMKATMLKAGLKDWKGSRGWKKKEKGEPTISKGELDRLKALGYVL